MITICGHVGGRGVFLLPVSAPSCLGLAGSSTSNTGQEVEPLRQLPEVQIPQWLHHGRRIMPDIHRQAMLLVTAVHELFGTHRIPVAFGELALTI